MSQKLCGILKLQIETYKMIKKEKKLKCSFASKYQDWLTPYSKTTKDTEKLTIYSITTESAESPERL
jgi:hypothetical protein